jgi:hypothetical protein
MQKILGFAFVIEDSYVKWTGGYIPRIETKKNVKKGVFHDFWGYFDIKIALFLCKN